MTALRIAAGAIIEGLTIPLLFVAYFAIAAAAKRTAQVFNARPASPERVRRMLAEVERGQR